MVTINGSASWLCDQYGHLSYPKTMSWNETTTDCCSWDGIKCDRMIGQVIELDLSCSQLYGTILPNNSLFSLRHLQRLNLAFNDFTQSRISSSFGQFSSLTHLNLSSSFSGSIPLEISHLSKLVSLDLFSYYQFVKLEPYNFHVLLQNLTQLQYLCLARVNISSIVPISLNIVLNELTGLIPANLRGLSNLRYLCSGYNSHTGTLPIWMYDLPSLTYLSLASNEFTGEIYEFQRCPDTCRHLEVLDFGNNKINDTFPYWLEFLPELQVLVFKSNKFHGHVNSSKTKLLFPKRRIFDLSHNEFSGHLPTTYFKHFNAMKMVNEKVEKKYMGQSYYSDSVTIMLKGNELFNLSHNSLIGNIPSSLGSLCLLESLDLSSNQLSGKIPSQLTQNHLEGHIPRGNQFKTFEKSSYNGNLALCGFPLSKECGDINTPQLHPTPMLHKEDDPTFASELIGKW
ncbi:hypothetical protein ACSBR1_025833 [Camellia fascicularis]